MVFCISMDCSERQLITDYLAGDEKSLEVLIKKYLKPIYSFVYCYVGNEQEAEDITQEVFVKVWKNLKKFQPEKKFSAWVFEIAKNTSLDWLKKSRSASGGKKAIPFSNFENEYGKNSLFETIADLSPNPAELTNRANAMETLRTAISQLPPSYQEAIILHSQKELTFQEIADKTSQSINTVKSRFRRALTLLRKLLFDIF